MYSLDDIKPFTVYRHVAHDMLHYYYQHLDCVIHINTSGPVINKLPVLHIVVMQANESLTEVTHQEYMVVATKALAELGFEYLSFYDPKPVPASLN